VSREVFDDLIEIFLAHKGKLLGLFIGLVIAILIISFGFLEAVFIIFCMAVGYFVGRRMDEKKSFSEIIERLMPPQN